MQQNRYCIFLCKFHKRKFLSQMITTFFVITSYCLFFEIAGEAKNFGNNKKVIEISKMLLFFCV